MITHTSKEPHPLVLSALVVQHGHGERLVASPVVLPIEDEAEVSSRPPHLCEVSEGGVQSGNRAVCILCISLHWKCFLESGSQHPESSLAGQPTSFRVPILKAIGAAEGSGLARETTQHVGAGEPLPEYIQVNSDTEI